MRKSFRGVSAGAEQAAVQATETCKTVQQLCIAKKTNPCPALTKCLAVRAYIIQVAVTAQLVALAGYTAVDLADKPRAIDWAPSCPCWQAAGPRVALPDSGTSI
jgi:hypothetical protein